MIGWFNFPYLENTGLHRQDKTHYPPPGLI